MRPITILVALAGLYLAAGSTSLGANATLQVQHTLAVLYSRIDQAATRKDPIGATAYCTRDFVAIGPTGARSSLPEQRESMRRVLRRMGPATFTTTIQKVYVKGRTAWVIVSSHLTATVTDPVTHHSRVSEVSSLARDTWTRTRTGWRLKSNQAMSAN